ncbi:MAG: hypothetical protein IJT96_09390 [Lachnospiraceae bacterium]|nr:hypothetical protein [Lachnospiraceae bacterium]
MGRVLGYDLNDLSCQVSISIENEGNEEVRSVPVLAGSERYVIPVAAYISDSGDVSYGEDAVRASGDDGKLITNLLSRAVKGLYIDRNGERYDYVTLLSGFMKRTMYMSSVLSPVELIERAVIAMPDVSEEYVKTVEEAAGFLKDEDIKYRITGYPECFFYYAMNQDASLTKNKIALFDYDGAIVRSMLLYTRVDTRPHLCMVEERDFDMTLKDDLSFLEIARSVLDSEIVSAVYLSGEGFEGGWLKSSVTYLCERRRRVFQGRNLYTKGACYAALDDRDGNPMLDICRFFDDEKLVSNIGLHMIRDGQETYIPLLEAGINWYEAKGASEFYLGDDREIRIRLESFFTKDVRYSVLRCDGFPKRPARCTRVRLEVAMKDNSCVSCKAYDLGFGDIYKSSGDTVETEVFI